MRIASACLMVFITGAGFAEDYYPRKSLEVGYERYEPANRRPDTAGTGLLVNYYPTRVFHIGTTQNVVSVGPGYSRQDFTYRPDLHLGFTIPLLDQLFAELTLGIDLLTSAIITAAFFCNKECFQGSSGNISRGSYRGFVNFGTALRWHWDSLALKVIAQMQHGGYSATERNELSPSAWFGLGATYRFRL